MKEVNIEAKQDTGKVDAAGKKVYTAVPGKCKQYATTAEAIKDLTEEATLGIINMHVKIRALDGLRKGTSVSLMKMFKTASPEAQEKIKKLLGM